MINDTLDAIFLGTFLFGLVFSALSLLVGVADIGFDGDGSDGGSGDDAGFWQINLGSILAFLTWFGGIGYLARHALGWLSILSIFVGLLGGLLGGVIILWFFARVIRPNDRALDPEDYRLPGTIARVTSSIRVGGTGEIMFEQAGVRQVAAARAVGDTALPRGTEVVVLRTERGIAVVDPWDSLIGERPTHPPEPIST
jgi:membrane protein implicated in regulation of membrane protease activity